MTAAQTLAPRLSICIATLNRARFLRETLDNIFHQAGTAVEVVVVDGASTDGTGALLEEYAAKEPRLRFERLPVKGGVDQDFCRAVELARGEYCWLFSDDDLLGPGAVDAVLRALEQDVALVIVNAQVRDRDMKLVVEESRLSLAQDVRVDAGQTARLFELIHAYISFIGCVVIERRLWLERLKAPYLGSEFVHVGVIFQAPLPRATIVISNSHIIIRQGNAQWTSRSFEIWMFKWPGLIWSLVSIPENIRQRTTRREPWRRFASLVASRASGGYSIEIYRRFLSSQSASPSWHLAAQLIAYTPKSICAKSVLAYLQVSRRR